MKINLPNETYRFATMSSAKFSTKLINRTLGLVDINKPNTSNQIKNVDNITHLVKHSSVGQLFSQVSRDQFSHYGSYVDDKYNTHELFFAKKNGKVGCFDFITDPLGNPSHAAYHEQSHMTAILQSLDIPYEGEINKLLPKDLTFEISNHLEASHDFQRVLSGVCNVADTYRCSVDLFELPAQHNAKSGIAPRYEVAMVFDNNTKIQTTAGVHNVSFLDANKFITETIDTFGEIVKLEDKHHWATRDITDEEHPRGFRSLDCSVSRIDDYALVVNPHPEVPDVYTFTFASIDNVYSSEIKMDDPRDFITSDLTPIAIVHSGKPEMTHIDMLRMVDDVYESIKNPDKHFDCEYDFLDQFVNECRDHIQATSLKDAINDIQTQGQLSWDM